MNYLKKFNIIYLLVVFTFIACEKETDIVETYYNDLTNIPSDVLSKFSESQQQDISNGLQVDNKCKSYFESYDIEYWNYPVYGESGNLISYEFPVFGSNQQSENKSSTIILNHNVKQSLMMQENKTIEAGKANINYWENNNMGSEQLMVNVETTQENNWDIEKNISKFYITNGTGNFSNMKGFAYTVIEIEKEATFGCYPNNNNVPDSFENGTCATLTNCSGDCSDGAGKGKLYLIGFLCD